MLKRLKISLKIEKKMANKVTDEHQSKFITIINKSKMLHT